MNIKSGNVKERLWDHSLFILPNEVSWITKNETDFRKSLQRVAEKNKSVFNKRITVSSRFDHTTITIDFEMKENNGDFTIVIHKCQTSVNGKTHNYIGVHNVAIECNDNSLSSSLYPSIKRKDTNPFYVASSISTHNGPEMRSITNKPIYLFNAFISIAERFVL